MQMFTVMTKTFQSYPESTLSRAHATLAPELKRVSAGRLLLSTGFISFICQRISLVCFFSCCVPRTEGSGYRSHLSVVSKSSNLFPSPARKTQLLIFPAATRYVVLLLGNKQQTGLTDPAWQANWERDIMRKGGRDC